MGLQIVKLSSICLTPRLHSKMVHLGFDVSSGGLPHKREFARVVTAWKTAKVIVETKLQTDAVARAHGVPVTLLPCDWTSILAEFKKKTRFAHLG